MQIKLGYKPQGEKRGQGILVITFGNDPILIQAGIEDAVLLSPYVGKTQSHNILKAEELLDVIQNETPEVLHLLAQVDEQSALEDANGTSLRLHDLMKHAEKMGVRLFIIANGNSFDHVKKDFYHSEVMDFLAITDRNKHFSVFLKGLIERMSKTGSFAKAYVALAPQHSKAQQGLPLPGSIAVCPTKKGKDLVLWSEAQSY